MRDESGRLILEPVRKKDLKSLLSGWKPLDDRDSLPEIEDLPAEPVDL
jgi:hypothetical protein